MCLHIHVFVSLFRVCVPTPCCHSMMVTSKVHFVLEAPASMKGPRGKACVHTHPHPHNHSWKCWRTNQQHHTLTMWPLLCNRVGVAKVTGDSAWLVLWRDYSDSSQVAMVIISSFYLLFKRFTFWNVCVFCHDLFFIQNPLFFINDIQGVDKITWTPV